MASVSNHRSLMVLYSSSNNPIEHAVRIVLAEKDVNAEIRYIDNQDIPEELGDINPYHSTPTLIDRDLVLYDAEIIMEYLDERFPHPPLMPVDPVNRAGNRQLRYRVMRDLYRVIHELNSENEIAAINAKKVLRDHLTAISPTFSEKLYFMSDDYSMVDCCMAPLMWRLDQYGIKLPMFTKPLKKYADRLFERKAFQDSLSETESYV